MRPPLSCLFISCVPVVGSIVSAQGWKLPPRGVVIGDRDWNFEAAAMAEGCFAILFLKLAAPATITGRR